jgi:surfeit locus 1 family protein
MAHTCRAGPRSGGLAGYGDRVLRTACKPRWLALLALALLLASAMAWLGNWQLTRAREQSRARAIEAAENRPAVELTSLLKARQSFTNAAADRPITVSGRWDGAHQLLVAERYLDDRRGYWVLTPLVLPDDSAVAVVRGWVPSPSDPAAAPDRLPTGPVSLAGVLRPSEPPIDRLPGETAGLPAGQVDGVDLTQLVQLWPAKLITGYVILTSQEPAPAGAALTVVPATAPSNDAVAWQNLSYAVQWFVFAGFMVFLWLRLVREDFRTTPRPGPATNADPTSADADLISRSNS